MYGVVGPHGDDDEERELDNPIYGMEDTVNGGYMTPHFETTYSSMDI